MSPRWAIAAALLVGARPAAAAVPEAPADVSDRASIAEPHVRIELPEAPADVSDRANIAEPHLRIELVEKAPEVTLYVREAARVVFSDGEALVLPADSHLTFSLRSARQPQRRWAVGVRTYTYADGEKAGETVAQWRAKGHTVRLVEAGKVFTAKSGDELVDTRRYWILLGEFDTEAGAKTLERKLQRQGTGTWIFMETVAPASGQLEIRKRGSDLAVTGPTPARLTSTAPVEIENVVFGVGFWGRGHREHRTFAGALEIDATEDGKVTVLNAIDLEDYIRGVLPVEISVKAPIEAMKAQAVAARTETFAKLRVKHFGEPFDLCASQHCQEYGGLTRTTADTNAAVEATRGIALMSNKKFVDAVYSANCGGHTEDNDKVWTSNPSPALRGVLDGPKAAVPFASPITSRALRRWLTTRPQTYCGDPRVGEPEKYRWRKRMSAAKLKRLVNRHYAVGAVQDIKLGRRGVSGRLRRVDIIGDKDRVTVRKELNIRRVFGGLKSAMFILEVKRDGAGVPKTFTFIGGGWGHGVGLCQNGAMGMGLDGFKYPAILMHYFSHSYLQRVYD